MSAPLLPQSFWFRLSVPCRRVDAIPRSRGASLDLPDACVLLPARSFEGEKTWAEVRAGWSPSGLAFSVDVSGKKKPPAKPLYEGADGDSFRVWIDTRDTRTIHRASRFCHRFSLTLAPNANGLDVTVRHEPIARALGDPTSISVDSIVAQAESRRGGWHLDVFFPKASLNGFDPETNRRLGLAYQVADMERENLLFPVGRDFPIGEDPSLWATLELVDP